jgi:hypothetical protein
MVGMDLHRPLDVAGRVERGSWIRGLMDLPNLKIKSKTTVRKAAAPSRRDAGVEGWRPIAALSF